MRLKRWIRALHTRVIDWLLWWDEAAWDPPPGWEESPACARCGKRVYVGDSRQHVTTTWLCQDCDERHQ